MAHTLQDKLSEKLEQGVTNSISAALSDKDDLTAEEIAAAVLKGEQRALEGADGLGGDRAVLVGVILAVFADKAHHGTQILEVEQEHSLVVSDAEDHLQGV